MIAGDLNRLDPQASVLYWQQPGPWFTQNPLSYRCLNPWNERHLQSLCIDGFTELCGPQEVVAQRNSRRLRGNRVLMLNLNADVFHEAVEAWVGHCELRMIDDPPLPTLAESSIDDTGIVTLRNQDGFLATYSTQRKRIMTNL